MKSENYEGLKATKVILNRSIRKDELPISKENQCEICNLMVKANLILIGKCGK